ncbi:MAG: hypothetical protein U9Q05_01665 [Thermodesulfobacteriota bacterium]|nr:hypothetical protein [Thermodesulfobacteriota bacterium]
MKNEIIIGTSNITLDDLVAIARRGFGIRLARESEKRIIAGRLCQETPRTFA